MGTGPHTGLWLLRHDGVHHVRRRTNPHQTHLLPIRPRHSLQSMTCSRDWDIPRHHQRRLLLAYSRETSFSTLVDCQLQSKIVVGRILTGTEVAVSAALIEDQSHLLVVASVVCAVTLSNPMAV